MLSVLANNLLSWTTGEKTEVFKYFDLLTTETHLEQLILTDKDTSTLIEYNLLHTQEFEDCYLDD